MTCDWHLDSGHPRVRRTESSVARRWMDFPCCGRTRLPSSPVRPPSSRLATRRTQGRWCTDWGRSTRDAHALDMPQAVAGTCLADSLHRGQTRYTEAPPQARPENPAHGKRSVDLAARTIFSASGRAEDTPILTRRYSYRERLGSRRSAAWRFSFGCRSKPRRSTRVLTNVIGSGAAAAARSSRAQNAASPSMPIRKPKRA